MAGPLKPTYELHHGDCVEVMRSMPADSVDAIVTSPPYAMQRKATYGGVPEAGYPAWTVAWMAEAWRVLKPNGSVLINIRPHIRNGQISDYTLRTRLALREAGWNECEELIWNKMGGAPLGSPHRPRRSWESIHWFAKHGRPWNNPRAAGKPSDRVGFNPSSRSGQNNNWLDRAPLIHSVKPGVARVSDVIPVHLSKNASNGTGDHPAPYPVALAEWLGKLICPPGGTILDPFSGSASTGVAAIRNGWHYIGVDAIEEYVEMSRVRLEAEAA